MEEDIKIEQCKKIKEKMEEDNKKMLDALIEEIEEKMRTRDLSDSYLKEHNLATREDIGIGEYSYGINMIPCEWVYSFLLDLQIKNKTVEKLLKRNKELEEENKELKEYIFVAPNLDEMTAVKYSHIQRDAYFRGRAEEQQKAEQIIHENYIPKSKAKEKIEEIVKLIESEQFKIIMGDMTKVNRIKYLLQELMEGK